ncbi:MAG: hypothetical protein ACOCUW_00145 [Gemmatimonadota bacterium]
MTRNGGSGVVLLALAALTVAADRAGAQDRPRERTPPTDSAAQDTVPDTESQDTVPRGPALGYEPPALSVVLTVGLPGGGEAQSQPVTAYRTDLAGTVLDSVVLGRTQTVQGGIRAGIAVEWSLGTRWAVRVAGGAATASLETGYRGPSEVFVPAAEAIAHDDAELRVLSAETALRYRIPSRRRVRPYLELGAGFSRWSFDGATAGPATDVTRFEVLAAVGAVIPLRGRISARVHASSRMLRTPVDLVVPGDTAAASSALTLIAREPDGTTFADGARETLGLTSLDLGLSVGLGSVPAPPAPAATVDTPSPPDR